MDANQFGLSPVGEALWPWLNKADTKFGSGGYFSVRLRVTDPDQAELFAKNIDERIKERVDLAKVRQLTNEIKVADPPYYRCDDNSVVFTFKVRAIQKGRRGRKRNKITIADAKGQAKKLVVGHGSLIRVGFKYEPFHSGLIGVGCSLRPNCVQVIKHVDPCKIDASRFGFIDETLLLQGVEGTE